MTSEERKQARYLRRRAARIRKKREKNRTHDDYERVFTYGNLFRSYRKSRRNVSWKASVQRYMTFAPIHVHHDRGRVLNETWRSEGFCEFDINERGKVRHIRSVMIDERVIQRCLCDYALVPVLSRTFIYDNAASLQNKGYHFALRRLEQHLREHYRKYGCEGYVLLFDFRKFFDNISHAVCMKIVRREFTDERIVQLVNHFVDMFGERGLGLGSQVSQILSLASANRLDHFIKEICRIRGYGRYMDDGYVIHRSKAVLKQIRAGIQTICKKLGIVLNEKKTQIVKLTHGFTFLKARIYLLPGGKILKKIPKVSITRERKKLKKLGGLFRSGVITAEDLYTSFQSWRAYAKNFKAYHTIRKMTQLYRSILNSCEYCTS